MTRNFNDLADRVKADWSPEAVRVYQAAVSEFVAEADERLMLGQQLATARKAQSLSQSALAALTGVQQAEISKIERGLANPTTATVNRLIVALGLRISLQPAKGLI